MQRNYLYIHGNSNTLSVVKDIIGERQEAQILKFNAPPLHT